MGKIAFLFSGQGSQYSGMGQELYSVSPAAKSVFDAADKLRPHTSTQCFSGSLEELTETRNTQPCMFCVELAAANALVESGIHCDLAAGFSLGEIAALTFTGAISFADGFHLVCSRGTFMQEAAGKTDAAMAAVLKLDDETVNRICAEFSEVYPVNYNSPGQVVISAAKNAMEKFSTRIKESGGRILPLKVAGGFHSPFMAPAAERFAEEIKKYTLEAPLIPLYSNVTAMPYDDNLRTLLTKQIVSPVLWTKTINNMIEAGADTFIEVGPGKVLRGLVSRISDTVKIYNVEDENSLQKTIAEVNPIA